jgi:hypothetical protein
LELGKVQKEVLELEPGQLLALAKVLPLWAFRQVLPSFSLTSQGCLQWQGKSYKHP